MNADTLSPLLEKEAKRVLKAAREQSFKDQLDAFKLCVLWWAQSRRIGTNDDGAGSLLTEMKEFIDASDKGKRGSGGTSGSYPYPISLPDTATDPTDSSEPDTTD